jgi:hypothetical protein
MSKHAKKAAIGVAALIGVAAIGVLVVATKSLPDENSKSAAPAPKLVAAIGLEQSPAPKPVENKEAAPKSDVASAFGQALALGEETKPTPKTGPAPGSNAGSSAQNTPTGSDSKPSANTLDLGITSARDAQLETRHATSLNVRQVSPGLATREKAPKDTDSPITFETQMH